MLLKDVYAAVVGYSVLEFSIRSRWSTALEDHIFHSLADVFWPSYSSSLRERMLTSPTVIAELSISLFNAVHFCLMVFEALLLGTQP